MTRRSLWLAAAACAIAAATPAGAGAAVTVSLRIEGPASTLFEGPVTTDVRPFQFTGDPVAHECDATVANQGTSSVPVPTRGAAIATASQLAPFAMTGTFSASLGSPSFETIAGQSVAFDPASNRFLVEYKNGVAATIGSCGDPIANGDDVVFGFGTGAPTEHVLRLTGPATAAPGQPITVRVTNEAGGAPLAGATVEGRASAADGTITVGPYTTLGPHDLKATRSGDIRSNRLTVCITSGADGACGTTVPGPGAAPPAAKCVTTGDDGLCGTRDRRAPLGRILSIRNAQKFRRHHGPRLLRGDVSADPSGIAGIRLRLTRRHGGRCSTFHGRKGRFVRIRVCGAAHGRWFAIGTEPRWSFLLPRRLGPGRYVLDVQARDRAGNRDRSLVPGRSRVVFRVLRGS